MRPPRFLVLLALLAYATGLSVVLAWKNRDLRDRNAELVRQSQTPQPGMYVPAFAAVTIDGDELIIGDPPPGSRQLLLVFDTRCPYCLGSVPAWQAMRQVLERDDEAIRLLGISLDPENETRRYRDEHHVGFPVVVAQESRIRSMYRWRAVPLIMVVEPEGLVSYARAGELWAGPALDSVLAVARTARRVP